MSAYDAIEAAVITLLQTETRFAGHTNRVTTEFKIMDMGEPEGIVIQMGGFTPEEDAGRMHYRDWDVMMGLFVRIGSDPDAAWDALKSLRGDTIDLLAQYPTLNKLNGVVQTTTGSDGDPTEIFDKLNQGPFFVGQILRLTVTHRADISGGEF
jgi:hypothetical protein